MQNRKERIAAQNEMEEIPQFSFEKEELEKITNEIYPYK